MCRTSPTLAICRCWSPPASARRPGSATTQARATTLPTRRIPYRPSPPPQRRRRSTVGRRSAEERERKSERHRTRVRDPTSLTVDQRTLTCLRCALSAGHRRGVRQLGCLPCRHAVLDVSASDTCRTGLDALSGTVWRSAIGGEHQRGSGSVSLCQDGIRRGPSMFTRVASGERRGAAWVRYRP